MTADETPRVAGDRLDSWKAIAAFLGRDVRTVMRWEKSEGLPVHRHQHQLGRSVYAYPEELRAWQSARRVEPSLPTTVSRSRWRWLAAALCVAAASAAAGDIRLEQLGATASGVIDQPLGWPEDASMAADASLSADGQYVSFVDQHSNELTIKDLRSGREWPLTRVGAAGGWVEWSAISKDSQFVAFASKDAGPSFTSAKLRVLPLDATPDTPPRVVAAGQWFEPMDWSADGRELLVRVERDDRTVDIGIVDVTTSSYRMLKRFPRPFPDDVVRLSPDGRYAAFARVPELTVGHHDVNLLATGSGAEIPLLDGPSSDTVVGWSPDGSQLLFKSDRSGTVGLWAVPVVEGKLSGPPSLVRDGLDLEPHTITASGDLFYEREVGTTGGTPTRALMTATVDPAAGTLLAPPWFAAHDRAARSGFPRWSRDGSEFLYLTRRPGGRVLSIRSVRSNQIREIPLALSYIWTFDWSPDRKWLAFRATDVAGRNGIFLVDASTGRSDLITPEQDEFQAYRTPQFTQDGRGITYFRRQPPDASGRRVTSYVRWDLASRTERVLERDAAGLGADRYAMGRSPDGRYRLSIYTSLRQVPSRLFAYDTATGREAELFSSQPPNAFNYEDGLQWMPDGRAVLVNVRSDTPNVFHVWWIPVDGRQPRRLDIGAGNLVNSAIAVHPNGREISFLAGDPIPTTASSPRREFRLLRNFIPHTTKHDNR